jgi:hypothetical protein
MPTQRQERTDPMQEIMRDRINSGWQVYYVILWFNPASYASYEQEKIMFEEVERLYDALVPMSMLRPSTRLDQWERPVWLCAPSFDLDRPGENDTGEVAAIRLVALVHPEKRVDLALGIYMMIPKWSTDEPGVYDFECRRVSEPNELDELVRHEFEYDDEFIVLPAQPAVRPLIERRRNSTVANEDVVIFPDGRGGWKLIDLSLRGRERRPRMTNFR